jgi:hypothetical protein
MLCPFALQKRFPRQCSWWRWWGSLPSQATRFLLIFPSLSQKTFGSVFVLSLLNQKGSAEPWSLERRLGLFAFRALRSVSDGLQFTGVTLYLEALGSLSEALTEALRASYSVYIGRNGESSRQLHNIQPFCITIHLETLLNFETLLKTRFRDASKLRKTSNLETLLKTQI